MAVTPEEEKDLLHPVSEFTLKQGDLLYMPPATFHKVGSFSGPRVSISIPFFVNHNAKRMDRSRIPFQKVFSENLSQPAAAPD